MRWTVLLTAIVLFMAPSEAPAATVFVEDFSDGELATNPTWTGTVQPEFVSVIDGRLRSNGQDVESDGRFRSILDTDASFVAPGRIEMSFDAVLLGAGNPQEGRAAVMGIIGASGGMYRIGVYNGFSSGFAHNQMSISLVYDQAEALHDLITTTYTPQRDVQYHVTAIREQGIWSLFVGTDLVGSAPDPLGLTSFSGVHMPHTGSVVVDSLLVVATDGPSEVEAVAFLHGTGSTANPPTLFVDENVPVGTIAKYSDSKAIKFAGGNSWKEIGTWTADPAFSTGTLDAVGDLEVWVGLKNSDDIGTRFDLRAEVYRNDSLVASGETYCIQGVTRNPALAKEVSVSFDLLVPDSSFNGTSDVLRLKILTRIGTDGAGGFCGGHSNAVGLRLYHDAETRPSSFEVVLRQALGREITTSSFAAHVDFATGEPHDLTLGDINGDGKPDLVVAAQTASRASVFLNTTAQGAATPSLAAKVDFATGARPISVALADLNGDGKPDLVVVNEQAGTVSVLVGMTATGAATPTFAPRVDFAAGANPRSIGLADLNADGKPDLVVANYTVDTASVLLNTTLPGAATPTFAGRVDFATGPSPDSPAVGDLNGDGKPDLVVVNNNDNTASVLLNTTAPGAATPSFAAKVDFVTGVGPASVALAELNGDGRPDLAVANFTDSTVSVLLNTTAPGAAAPSFAAKVDFATGANPRFVSLADVNGDGKPDLAVANYTASTASVLVNTTAPGAATPSFATKVDFATGATPVYVAVDDLNGDGKPDLVTSNFGGHTASVLLQQ